MKTSFPIIVFLFILFSIPSPSQQITGSKKFAWERFFVLEDYRSVSSEFWEEGIYNSLGYQKIHLEEAFNKNPRLLSLDVKTIPDPLISGMEDYYKESSAFIINVWLEKAMDFIQREKDFVGGYKNSALLYAVAHIFDAFLLEQSNALVEDDALRTMSISEQYAYTLFDKAVLKLGENIMFDILNDSFDQDLSLSNMFHTLYNQPQKSFVLLGIAGGFAGYLGLQYVSKDYIVFPPISIDLSPRVSMDLDVIYVGKGFSSNSLYQLPGSEQTKSRRNPVPCMVSLNIAL